VVGKSPFLKSLKQPAVAKLLILNDEHPDNPDFVLPEAGKLRGEGWVTDPDDRPSFNEILRRLERMNFKLTVNVNSSKLSKFVKKVKEWKEVRSAQ
jgi:hypothetical protein